MHTCNEFPAFHPHYPILAQRVKSSVYVSSHVYVHTYVSVCDEGKKKVGLKIAVVSSSETNT